MTKTLKSNSKWLYACAWAPDAKTLASVGDNRSVSTSGINHIPKVTKGTCIFKDDFIFRSDNSIHVLSFIVIERQKADTRRCSSLTIYRQNLQRTFDNPKRIKVILALSEHYLTQSLLFFNSCYWINQISVKLNSSHCHTLFGLRGSCI